MFNNQLKKANSWKEVIKNCSCYFCQKKFTEKDIQEKKYQVVYAFCYGTIQIHDICHLDCRQWYPNGTDCYFCQKVINNLIVVNLFDVTYHPECLEKGGIYYQKHVHPKLLRIETDSDKITAYLEDKREISILIIDLVKRWRKSNLKVEQLKKYEIDPWGFNLHFPDADIDTSVLIFTGNYCGCC